LVRRSAFHFADPNALELAVWSDKRVTGQKSHSVRHPEAAPEKERMPSQISAVLRRDGQKKKTRNFLADAIYLQECLGP